LIDEYKEVFKFRIFVFNASCFLLLIYFSICMTMFQVKHFESAFCMKSSI
jgi:hypothetical protein